MIAQLSGPIIKDHLFFYGLYDARNVTSRFGSTSPSFGPTGELEDVAGTFSYAARTSSPFYAGKIDAVIVDGQRLAFTYFNTSGTTVSTLYNPYKQRKKMTETYSRQRLFSYGGREKSGKYV